MRSLNLYTQGTLPFMAIDVLLYDIVHTVIYDAESLFYVLIWISFLYSGPNETERKMTKEFYLESILTKWSPLKLGKDVSLKDVAKRKKFTMTVHSEFITEILWNKDPFFSALDDCLSNLRSALFPPAPLPLPSAPRPSLGTTANIMSHRDKEHVLEGMKKALTEAKEKLEKTSENPTPEAANRSESDNVEQTDCANLEYVKDLRLRQVVEDLEEKDKLGRVEEEEEPVDNKEVGMQGDQGQNSSLFGEVVGEGAGEASPSAREQSEHPEENSRTNIEERRLISGQTLIGSLGSPVSRSSAGKRSASIMVGEAVPESTAISFARPQKRSRTTRSMTLDGSRSDNSA